MKNFRIVFDKKGQWSIKVKFWFWWRTIPIKFSSFRAAHDYATGTKRSEENE